MIGVFITLHYGDDFDEEGVRKIAETARGRFEGMPGLRCKAFTINSGKREATNFLRLGLSGRSQNLFHRRACGTHNGSLRRTPERRVRADCRARGEHPDVMWSEKWFRIR
jgi:hypothetical protein